MQLLLVEDNKNQREILVGKEKEHIRKVLDSCDDNQLKAAKILGIHRNTLARKIKEFNL